jgi:hypothetical protein
VEINNLLEAEIRDLSPGRTIQWLKPNVVDSIFPDGLGQRFSVTATEAQCQGCPQK